VRNSVRWRRSRGSKPSNVRRRCHRQPVAQCNAVSGRGATTRPRPGFSVVSPSRDQTDRCLRLDVRAADARAGPAAVPVVESFSPQQSACLGGQARMAAMTRGCRRKRRGPGKSGLPSPSGGSGSSCFSPPLRSAVSFVSGGVLASGLMAMELRHQQKEFLSDSVLDSKPIALPPPGPLASPPPNTSKPEGLRMKMWCGRKAAEAVSSEWVGC
jgi:hypothetical protein